MCLALALLIAAAAPCARAQAPYDPAASRDVRYCEVRMGWGRRARILRSGGSGRPTDAYHRALLLIHSRCPCALQVVLYYPIEGDAENLKAMAYNT